jgi:hypothetical protein
VSFLDDAALVRHSRHLDGPMLVFNRDEWGAFLLGTRNGEFDFPE